MYKLNIYNYENIDEYENIMFIDGDIYCFYDMGKFFECNLTNNTLYACYESTNNSSHMDKWFGFADYTQENLNYFKNNNIYVFNAGLYMFKNNDSMKTHFKQIQKNVLCYEQMIKTKKK
jgi:lipopolysaccharide biosynthesis glycosyltransferase